MAPEPFRWQRGDLIAVPKIVHYLLWYRVRGVLEPGNIDRSYSPAQTHNNDTKKEAAIRLGRLIEGIARRLPFECNCLPRALTCSRLLDVNHRVHVGTRRIEDTLQAHAWISVDDTIVCGGASAADYDELTAPDDRERRK